MKLAVRKGRVALPEGLQDLDVLVEDGRIAALGRGLAADRELDASGCYVLPGFLDFHVHVDDRIGRYYLADTYATASAEALANGITTLCSFVTEGPDQPLLQAMRAARDKAVGRCHGDVLWHLTPTRFEAADLDRLEALVRGGYRTLKLYTTYRQAGIYASYDLLELLFRRFAPLGATFLVHCEDDDVIASVDPASVDLGRAASHGLLRPERAEVVAIARVLDLARIHRAAVHIVHVSTLEGARLIAAAHADTDVTCETCPQYLVLDDTFLAREDGHRWLCSPPLRGGREAFHDLARRGGFEMIATDHCPFRPEDKDAWDGRDLRQVPNGLPGLGALAHVTWKIWEDDPDRAALGLATHLALNPARRAGVADRKGALRPGLDADLVVLDPRGPERPVRACGVPAHEPFPGLTTRLHFRAVLLRGEPRIRDGRLLEPDRPLGQPLQPEPEPLTHS